MKKRASGGSKLDGSFERHRRDICLVICEALGWPHDLPLEGPELGHKKRHVSLKRPVPFSDEGRGTFTTHREYVEFTDNEGRRLRIGPGRFSVR